MSVFGVILVRIFPHSNWMRRDTKNTDQNNSEYRHFSSSEGLYQTSVVERFCENSQRFQSTNAFMKLKVYSCNCSTIHSLSCLHMHFGIKRKERKKLSLREALHMIVPNQIQYLSYTVAFLVHITWLWHKIFNG